MQLSLLHLTPLDRPETTVAATFLAVQPALALSCSLCLQAVTTACKKHGGFYLGSIGGPAAILALNCIKKVDAFDEAPGGSDCSGLREGAHKEETKPMRNCLKVHLGGHHGSISPACPSLLIMLCGHTLVS